MAMVSAGQRANERSGSLWTRERSKSRDEAGSEATKYWQEGIGRLAGYSN